MATEGNNSFHTHGRKLYLFAAAALAVFVFVMAIGRSRTGQMVASAVLLHEVPSGVGETLTMRPLEASGHDLLHVRQSIASDEFLERLLATLPSELAAQLEADHESPQARVDSVRARFVFALDEQSDGNRPTGVAVRFLHEQGKVARHLVNAAVNEFAKNEHKTAIATLYRDPHEEARRAAAQAKLQWNNAEMAVRGFVNEYQSELDQIRNPAGESQQPKPAAIPSTASPGDTLETSVAISDMQTDRDISADVNGPLLADPSFVGPRYAQLQIDTRAEREGLSPTDSAHAEINLEAGTPPELSVLDADLAELQQIKLELLGRVTPDHPHVLDLNSRIDQLSAHVMAIRERFKSQQARADTGEQHATMAPVMSDVERTRILAEYQRLRNDADIGRAAHRRLAAVERNRWLRQLDERRAPRWRAIEADQSTLQHEPTSVAMTLLALAMGLTAGAGLLATAGMSVSGFSTIEEAEDALPVPVVGKLPSRQPFERKVNRQRAARAVLLTCEIVLASFLLAMIVAVALDGDFAETIKKDPLAAVSDGWRRLTSLWTR